MSDTDLIVELKKAVPMEAAAHAPKEAPARSGPARTGSSRWLSLSGLDAAKAGLALYIMGMLTSGVYYARFHILALDFTRIQSIVVGIYLIALYLALPAGFVWCAAQFSALKSVRLLISLALLAAMDVGLAVLLKYQGHDLAMVALTTLAFQLVLFVDWKTLLACVRERKLVLQLLHQPTRERLVALGLLVCLHFSLFWFPRIPGNFAGGMPVQVQVFTETPGLPDSRFVATKNKPQINSQMDSYALWLLYQTDTDVYLLDSLPANGTLIDDDVMRITQDQVIRMDYNTAP
ncbi:MAG: hypothetical protein ACLPY1_11700 [Terracidiphilus sp.]